MSDTSTRARRHLSPPRPPVHGQHQSRANPMSPGPSAAVHHHGIPASRSTASIAAPSATCNAARSGTAGRNRCQFRATARITCPVQSRRGATATGPCTA